MEIKLGTTHLEEKSAALAIYDDALYFIELNEDSETIRKFSVPLAEDCIQKGHIKNFSLLEKGMAEIIRQTGKIRDPVSVGLPSGETIIKLLTFPKMELEDVRGSIDVNFEEYFPYQRHDAVFDVVRAKTPADLRERDEASFLVACAKRETVEEVFEISRKAGFPAGAIEPVNFAMFRAIPEAQNGLCLFADLNSIIAVWEGLGIYYRTANNAESAQEILNTMQYMDMQQRNVRIEKIITFGLNYQLGDDPSSGVKIINVDDEYFGAEGLALRSAEGASALDIRPMEFVELEKRRYSFNINRVILWGLLVGFITLSLGTITFSINSIKELEAKMDVMRDNVSDFTRQRIALTEENSRLEKQKAKAEKILEFLQSDIPVLEILDALEINSGNGLKFDTADFSQNIAGITVVLDGKAEDEKSVLNTTEGLKNSGKFKSVMLPVSQRDQTGRIVFKIILIVGNINEG